MVEIAEQVVEWDAAVVMAPELVPVVALVAGRSHSSLGRARCTEPVGFRPTRYRKLA